MNNSRYAHSVGILPILCQELDGEKKKSAENDTAGLDKSSHFAVIVLMTNFLSKLATYCIRLLV